jgi:ubiquinone biosynthesis protein COQ4
MNPRGPTRSTIDLPRAARALSALIKNPDDLPQVFDLIDSMSTVGHFRRARSRFEKTDTPPAIVNWNAGAEYAYC